MSKLNNAEEQRRKEKQKFWSAHIDTWKKSGLSQAEYCRQQNLKSYQLSYWINRKPHRIDSLPVLVEIPIRESAPQIVSGSGLQLVTRYGEQVNINDNFSRTVKLFERIDEYIHNHLDEMILVEKNERVFLYVVCNFYFVGEMGVVPTITVAPP